MKKLALVGILSVLGFGCGDDDGGRTGTDSGLTLMDSGTITLPDTGTMMMPDAGGSMCAPERVDAPTMATCTQQQIMDLQTAAGMGDAALNAWFNDAANTACAGCLNVGILACATDNGCDDEWGEIGCCLETACAGATTQEEFDACVETELDTTCAGQNTAFDGCIGALPRGTCGIDPVCVMM
ncbi:MAG: hypothetical protein H6722_05450 [Sandaracinus sp.]|nr:hypothetical protein [Sandaracinus sp.]